MSNSARYPDPEAIVNKIEHLDHKKIKFCVELYRTLLDHVPMAEERQVWSHLVIGRRHRFMDSEERRER